MEFLPISFIEQGVRCATRIWPYRNAQIWIQGGIIAIYANEWNYKVEAVMAVTPVMKAAPEDKNRQSKQSPSKTFAKKFFAEVLDEAYEKEQGRSIEIQTNGYTRNALPFQNFVNLREYS